jgi:hypothetical protein
MDETALVLRIEIFRPLEKIFVTQEKLEKLISEIKLSFKMEHTNSGTCIKCNLELKKNCFYAFFVLPFYLQSVPVQSVNCVKIYTMACKRVVSSTLL